MSTIKDVAREAGVAVGTVSRYLNGIQIKETNRVKVEEAIHKLGFKLNPIARCLKTSKTNTIGVIIPSLSDPYGTMIVRSIEQKLYEYGYNIFVCDSWGSTQLEIQKAELLVQKMVDGIILYPCTEDISYLKDILSSSIPVVTLDVCTKGYECDQVITDNVNATYQAVEWLISNNHKSIGLITGSIDYFTSRERLKGYMRVLEDYSISIKDDLVKTLGFDEKDGFDAMLQLISLSPRPTAVVACNYYTTIGAVKAVYQTGIDVPGELSLVGFDNIGLSELVRPPLSIIVQPMEEMGNKAAELIINRISGGYTGFPSMLRLKTEFLPRQSTRRI